MPTPDRERKLRALNFSLWVLLFGLILSLIAGRNEGLSHVIFGLYSAFASAVVAILTAFIVGNVKVHGIQENTKNENSSVTISPR